MRSNIDAQMTVFDDGETRYVMPGAIPNRGRGWFGVWEFDSFLLSPRHRDLLVAAGYTQIDCRRRWTTFTDEQWAQMTPALPWLAWYLLAERAAESFYHNSLRLLWNLGMLEPHEAQLVSWRRDFRPFPWRGRRRMRRA